MEKPPRRPIRMARNRIATVRYSAATEFVAPHGTLRLVTGRALMARIDRFRALYPLCCICAAEGRTRGFDYVDHIHALEDGGPDTDANCWGLCHDCHVRKTNGENERRAMRGDCSVPLPWLPLRPVELGAYAPALA